MKRLRIHNPRRRGQVFEGRTGTALGFTRHGYVRVHLDGTPRDDSILMNPDILVFYDDQLPEGYAEACAAFAEFTGTGDGGSFPSPAAFEAARNIEAALQPEPADR